MFGRDDFPHEIYQGIFSFFSPKELNKISEVSKLFQQLANDNVLWKKFLSKYIKSQPQNNSYKEAYIQLYKKYFHFLNLPGNNYLQYLNDNQLSLEDLSSAIHPCKNVKLDQSPFDGLWLYLEKAPKLRYPGISVIDLQPKQSAIYGMVTMFSLADLGIDVFNMHHINRSPYDKNNPNHKESNTIMKWCSCFVIETNAIQPLINFVNNLADRLESKHHLPNLIILTKDNNTTEFIAELHRLKINIAAILPGTMDTYNLHLLNKSNLKHLSIEQRNMLSTIQFLTKVSRDEKNILAPTFEKPKENRCEIM